jgi:quercetin dioxygenase-like cupin family protein
MKSENLKPIAVPAEAGRVLDLIGVRHKLIEDQTGGAVYLFESEFGPGDGNRLHVHRYEDELAYVVEGALTIRLGDQDLQVGAGGIAYLPKSIPHAIQNPLTTPSRYLFAAIPGGSLERCFEAVQSAAEAGSLDNATRRELFLKYGVEFLE